MSGSMDGEKTVQKCFFNTSRNKTQALLCGDIMKFGNQT